MRLRTRGRTRRHRFSGHEHRHHGAFGPDSRLFARAVGITRSPRQIDSGECRVLRGHTDVVYAVAFHPDGTRLATAARDGAVWLWNVARGEAVARLTGHKSFVWSLAFSPDGASLASGAGDSTVRLWDTAPLKTRFHARREPRPCGPGRTVGGHLWGQGEDRTSWQRFALMRR